MKKWSVSGVFTLIHINTNNMQAINNYVIIKPIEDKKKESVIILAGEEKPKFSKGEIISVGGLCTRLSKGDIILMPRYSDECTLEGVVYNICKEEEISAIFNE